MRVFILLSIVFLFLGRAEGADTNLRPFAKSLGWKPITRESELPIYQIENDVVFMNTPNLLKAAQEYYELSGRGSDEEIVSVSTDKVPEWTKMLRVGPKDQIFIRPLSKSDTAKISISEIETFVYQYSAGGGGIHFVGFRIPPKKAFGSGLAWIGKANPFANSEEVKSAWSSLPVPPNLKNEILSAVKAEFGAAENPIVSSIEHRGLVVDNFLIGALRFKVQRPDRGTFDAYYLKIGSEKFFVELIGTAAEDWKSPFLVGKFLNDYDLFIRLGNSECSRVILVSKNSPQSMKFNCGTDMGG